MWQRQPEKCGGEHLKSVAMLNTRLIAGVYLLFLRHGQSSDKAQTHEARHSSARERAQALLCSARVSIDAL